MTGRRFSSLQHCAMHPFSFSQTTSSSPVASILSASENWGLSFQEEGKRPVGNASIEELQQYDAYYAQDTDEKNIYLTFDCGYENGNTEIILDALKKHNAPATFFVVGNFLSTSPEIVKRMISDGHIVGNHSYHHPDMSQISSIDSFSKELQELSDLYKETTGQEMKKYYRPPQGKYSETNLKMAKDLGYKTFFWSLAYVDWYQDNQPSKEEAFDKLLNRIHPGAIVLLHSTSSTNARILDELLGKWEEMGYQFRSLDYLVEQNAKKALSIADRAYVLETGSITMDGKAEDLLNDEAVQKAYLGE